VVAAETDGGDGPLGVRHQRRRQAAAGRAALLLPHLGRPPRLARFPHPPRRRRRRRRSRTTTELADTGEEFGQKVFFSFLSFCFGRLCYVLQVSPLRLLAGLNEPRTKTQMGPGLLTLF
jgi:hypothetical protein